VLKRPTAEAPGTFSESGYSGVLDFACETGFSWLWIGQLSFRKKLPFPMPPSTPATLVCKALSALKMQCNALRLAADEKEGNTGAGRDLLEGDVLRCHSEGQATESCPNRPPDPEAKDAADSLGGGSKLRT
jgi:hypothetical protein